MCWLTTFILHLSTIWQPSALPLFSSYLRLSHFRLKGGWWKFEFLRVQVFPRYGGWGLFFLLWVMIFRAKLGASSDPSAPSYWELTVYRYATKICLSARKWRIPPLISIASLFPIVPSSSTSSSSFSSSPARCFFIVAVGPSWWRVGIWKIEVKGGAAREKETACALWSVGTWDRGRR